LSFSLHRIEARKVDTVAEILQIDMRALGVIVLPACDGGVHGSGAAGFG